MQLECKEFQIKVIPFLAGWEKLEKDFEIARLSLFNSVGRRQSYLWNWVYTAAEITSLHYKNKKINQKIETHANMTKLLSVMWNVTIDDIADEIEIDTAKRLLYYVKNPDEDFSKLSNKECKYMNFSKQLHQRTIEMLSELGCFDYYKNILQNEYKYLLDCYELSLNLRNNAQQISLQKSINVLSYGMQMIINGIIDLMKLEYIPSKLEFQKIREILFFGQRMGRIGNSVTTYPYEIKVGDFSSEVVCLAVELQLLDKKILVNEPDYAIEILLNTNLEKTLLEYWDCYKKRILMLGDRLPELDIKKYVEGLSNLRQLHLQSRGKK